MPDFSTSHSAYHEVNITDSTMSTAAFTVAARRLAATGHHGATRRLPVTMTRAVPLAMHQPARAGVHTASVARAVGDRGEEPGMFEKIKRMFGISKQHVAGACSALAA